MKSIHLQSYIGHRIRLIRKKKGLSQQHLSEKILSALDITPAVLFESRISPKNPQLEVLVDQLIDLPETSQEQLLEAFQLLIKAVKDKPNR